MQKHTKVYISHFWELWLCEVCKQDMIVDVHHIKPRSFFWKKTKHLQDVVENLIWLCRVCHDKAHLKYEPYLRKPELQDIHNNYL